MLAPVAQTLAPVTPTVAQTLRAPVAQTVAPVKTKRQTVAKVQTLWRRRRRRSRRSRRRSRRSPRRSRRSRRRSRRSPRRSRRSRRRSAWPIAAPVMRVVAPVTHVSPVGGFGDAAAGQDVKPESLSPADREAVASLAAGSRLSESVVLAHFRSGLVGAGSAWCVSLGAVLVLLQVAVQAFSSLVLRRCLRWRRCFLAARDPHASDVRASRAPQPFFLLLERPG